MTKEEMIVDMEVEVEQSIQVYVLHDFTDGEVQETFVRDLFDGSLNDAQVETFLDDEDVQVCFGKLQDYANEYRRMVLEAYKEMQELPRQFRNEVL